MTDQRKTRVVCVGHAALDRVFSVESWPVESAKIVAHRFEECGGGMAANAAVAIARLGGHARFWGAVGDDATADIIEAQLRADGVDTRGLRRFPGTTSSTSAVLVDARGERLVVGYRGSALQAPAGWLPVEDVASAGAVLADVRWPAGAAVALQAARDAGIPAILDAEVATVDILESLVRMAGHAVFSERGLASFCTGGVEVGLRKAIDSGAEAAVVTGGGNGAWWMEAAEPDRLSHCPAFSIVAVDTLAAGDVFHGAYALAAAEGCSVEHAIRFASAAAAIKCTRTGGRGGAPGRDEVEAFLQGQVDRATGANEGRPPSMEALPE